MGWFSQFYNSSIGKKFIMAFTGSLLIIFLIVHLLGNLTLFFGEEAFNNYVATLKSFQPIVRVIEVLLALIFLYHIVYGFQLWLKNRKTRPQSYKINAKSKNTDIFSRTTIQTGSIIFIFLIIHLQSFWYPNNFSSHPVNLYNIVSGSFANWIYSSFYVLAIILLGFHLNHGFQSAFQTFGWNHKKYFPLIQKLGTFYSVIIAVGFASIPIYFLLGGR